jgi:hypothetical protein
LRGRLPLHRRNPPEDVPLCVQNHGQCVCVAVASAVELGSAETVAAAPPQQFALFSAELCKDRRKVRNDQRIEPARPGRRWSGRRRLRCSGSHGGDLHRSWRGGWCSGLPSNFRFQC